MPAVIISLQIGCNSRLSARCRDSSNVDDDGFTLDGTNYRVTEFVLDGADRSLNMRFGTTLLARAQTMTLTVSSSPGGTSTFDFASADSSSADSRTWNNTGLGPG